jgi:hypothetical protein
LALVAVAVLVQPLLLEPLEKMESLAVQEAVLLEEVP